MVPQMPIPEAQCHLPLWGRNYSPLIQSEDCHLLILWQVNIEHVMFPQKSSLFTLLLGLIRIWGWVFDFTVVCAYNYTSKEMPVFLKAEWRMVISFPFRPFYYKQAWMWLWLPLKGCWVEQPDGYQGKRPFEDNFVCFAKFMDSKRGIVKTRREAVVGLTKNSSERASWKSTLENKRNRCFIFPVSQRWEFPARAERLFNGYMLCLKYELWEFCFTVASHFEIC